MTKPPLAKNAIVILLDSLNRHMLGSYGGKPVKVRRSKFLATIGAEHVPVEAVEQDDDGVLSQRGLCHFAWLRSAKARVFQPNAVSGTMSRIMRALRSATTRPPIVS